MTRPSQEFGGDWTEEKLNRIRKYLQAYTTLMKNQPFKTIYVDAFAGTGYRSQKEEGPSGKPAPLIPELLEDDAQGFLAGSARIALEVDPPFETYIFIEKDEEYFGALQELQNEFPNAHIVLENRDANDYIQNDLSIPTRWRNSRAVVFLDPYGMEVEWATVEAIAKTRAIDLWLLFPLGQAVNRLLRRDADIPESYQDKLSKFFGTGDWFDAFYKKSSQLSFFDEGDSFEKVGDFKTISDYFVKRLKTVFPSVATPLPLYNSKRNPLFLLCFAVSNQSKQAQNVAMRIANHILSR